MTHEAAPLERLAEHLAARRLGDGDWDNVRLVSDWLDYSLNRCGLVVAPAQTKEASDHDIINTSE